MKQIKQFFLEGRSPALLKTMILTFILDVCIRTCEYQGVRNVCFSENLACFVFLLPAFWDSPFYLITNDLFLVNFSFSQAAMNSHCVKSVQIWSVFSCIWTEYTKTRTRKNSVFGHFSHCGCVPKSSQKLSLVKINPWKIPYERVRL